MCEESPKVLFPFSQDAYSLKTRVLIYVKNFPSQNRLL